MLKYACRFFIIKINESIHAQTITLGDDADDDGPVGVYIYINKTVGLYLDCQKGMKCGM